MPSTPPPKAHGLFKRRTDSLVRWVKKERAEAAAAWGDAARAVVQHPALTIAVVGACLALVYTGLNIVDQHIYGLLHVRPAEVGIDRPRLIEETTNGMLWVASRAFVLPLIVGAGLVSLFGSERFRIWLPRQVALLLAVICVISVALAYLICPSIADDIRSGRPASGGTSGGSHILDIDAVPFRFTRLPQHHAFDRGCVLYLGQANGQLVLYDVEHDSPLRLPQRDYGGEALYAPHAAAVADRCLDRGKAAAGAPVAERLEDVDAAGPVVVWSQRERADGPWELLVRRGRVKRLLVRSAAPLEPDLGRDPRGRLLVSYRSCRNGTCVVRARRIHGDAIETPALPRRGGCRAGWYSLSTEVRAVVLAGTRCAVADRGLWVQPPGGRWRRVPTTGLTVGDVDTLGDRVAWVERRGPVSRLRVLIDGARVEVRASATPLAAARLVRGGVIWTENDGDYGAIAAGAQLIDGPHPVARVCVGTPALSLHAGVGSVGHLAFGTTTVFTTTRSELLERTTDVDLPARLTTCSA